MTGMNRVEAGMGTDQYVALVVAMARNRVIGAEGGMPWHLPEDLAHFKAVTMGTPMVMGRHTFDSIGGPLPGRRSIVVTRDRAWAHPGVETAASLAEALEIAGPGRISLIGGGQLFEQAMETGLADELVVTHIEADPSGDTWFPHIDPGAWEVVERQPGTGCEFVTYRRRAT